MSTCRSSSSISMSPTSSTTGATSTPANDVWRRLAESNGRQAHEPVHALLGAEQPVGVLALGAEGGRLDAGLLPRADLEQLDLEAALLGPAHQHPQHHLGPVLGVGAARAGVDGDERVAGVVAAGEQPLLLELVEARLDASRAARRARRRSTRPPRPSRPARSRSSTSDVSARQRSRRRVDARVLGADLRGRGLVVPEARRAHLVLELGDVRVERGVVGARAQQRELVADRLQALGDREAVGGAGHRGPR